MTLSLNWSRVLSLDSSAAGYPSKQLLTSNFKAKTFHSNRFSWRLPLNRIRTNKSRDAPLCCTRQSIRSTDRATTPHSYRPGKLFILPLLNSSTSPLTTTSCTALLPTSILYTPPLHGAAGGLCDGPRTPPQRPDCCFQFQKSLAKHISFPLLASYYGLHRNNTPTQQTSLNAFRRNQITSVCNHNQSLFYFF